jgi:hypothetical protein
MRKTDKICDLEERVKDLTFRYQELIDEISDECTLYLHRQYDKKRVYIRGAKDIEYTVDEPLRGNEMCMDNGEIVLHLKRYDKNIGETIMIAPIKDVILIKD